MLLKNIKVEKDTNEIIKDKNRNINLDILKGIGIISVLIGHIGNKVSGSFVYTYHMAIFFFVSAYLYNEEKYGDKPLEYLIKRIRGMWGKYVFFSIVLISLHNVLNKFKFYPPYIKNYSIDNWLVKVLNSLLFNAEDVALGTLWFVPTLILALGVFGTVVYLSKKMSIIICKKCKAEDNSNIELIKKLLIVLISIILGSLGVYLNINNLSLLYRFHTSFVVIPICTMGYFFKLYKNIIKEQYKIIISIILLFITYIIIWNLTNKKGLSIDLYSNKIVNFSTFYIVSFIGILFCISLGNIISKIRPINNVIALIGKYSFYIMALHYICFKLVDVIYSNIIGDTNIWRTTAVFVAYPNNLWPLYIVIGCSIPLIIGFLYEGSIKK